MPRERKLNLLDYETGQVIKTYNSIKEALEELGIDRANLVRALKKTEGKMSRKKLRFNYADGVDNPLCARRVKQLDYDTGEVIEEYESINLAAKDNFIASKTLRNALNNRRGLIKSKNLRFEYA